MKPSNSNIQLGGALLLTAAAAAFILTSCSRSIPKGATAVKPFDVNRYTGRWYEIARLDFKQERGLNNTSADYSLNDDGSIKVLNKGYDTRKGEWREASGKAKFTDSDNEAKLKVSFFGPFYSGYNVIALDPDYKYALVAGKNLKYLWLLSRTTSMPDDIKQKYLRQAQEIGYQTDDLVWVEHNRAAVLQE
jgi:apolipoprotein D and lipocalin family protein